MLLQRGKIETKLKGISREKERRLDQVWKGARVIVVHKKKLPRRSKVRSQIFNLQRHARGIPNGSEDPVERRDPNIEYPDDDVKVSYLGQVQ